MCSRAKKSEENQYWVDVGSQPVWSLALDTYSVSRAEFGQASAEFLKSPVPHSFFLVVPRTSIISQCPAATRVIGLVLLTAHILGIVENKVEN